MDSSSARFFASMLQETAVPTVSDAYLQLSPQDPSKAVLTSFWKQNCYETEKSQQFSMLYNVSKKSSGDVIIEQLNQLPIMTEKYSLRSISPSGKLICTITKQANKESDKEDDIIDIFSTEDQKVICSVNLTSKSKHGIIHSNETFAALNWSPDEKSLVYIAEKKKSKHFKYFENLENEKNEENSSKDTVTGDKFKFEESWGELLNNVVYPTICVFNLKNRSIDTFEIPDDNIDPLQPAFIDNDVIVFEGLLKKPYKLGRIYCQNRVSAIYSLNMQTKELKKLTEDKLSMIFSPRVSPDQTKIVCLYKLLHESGDPHSSAVKLMIFDIQNQSHYFIEKFDSGDVKEESFPFYNRLSLSQNCWFSDSQKIGIEATINFRHYVCVIDLNSRKTIQRVECSSFFGVFSDYVLSSLMKLNWKHMILQITNSTSTATSAQPILNDFEVHEINNNNVISFGIKPGKTCLKSEKFPVIVWPHGGPHGVFLNSFNLYLSAFAKLGFGIAYVNYIGSTGYTEESLLKLPGNVGTLDVEDVHAVAQLYFEKFAALYDPENIFIFGGSHGGFLTAHHIGQFPKMYRAAALRNPVINISSMVSVTDIPDWTFVESGLAYNQAIIPDMENLKVMLSKSPIQYLKNIEAPVLLCIGEKDLRVPPFQGKNFHKLLLANGKVSRMLCYPNDSHPLSSIETECDVFVNVCEWFVKHGKLIVIC